MTKETINTRKCGSCNRWYNGCYDTDYDFWTGEADAGNCKYFKVKRKKKYFSKKYGYRKNKLKEVNK